MDISLAIETARKWRKGTIHTFVYCRKAKLPKKLEGNELDIRSVFQARVGIDYDNIKAVEEARAMGKAKGGLNGVESVEDDFIFTGKSGQPLIRVYPIKSAISSKEYILNGTKHGVDDLLASGFAKSVLGIHEGDKRSLAMYLDPTKIEAMN